MKNKLYRLYLNGFHVLQWWLTFLVVDIDGEIGCSLFEVKGNAADSVVVPASFFSMEEIGIDEKKKNWVLSF